jgi:hypothetical protein
MKKIITGASVLLTGALMFLSVFVAASNLGLIGGWDNHGRFLQAVSDSKLYPVLIISVVVMVAGIAILIWGNYKKSE